LFSSFFNRSELLLRGVLNFSPSLREVEMFKLDPMIDDLLRRPGVDINAILGHAEIG
jgi:hypothetical protein